MQLLVTGPVRDEGTIVVLEGVDEEGRVFHFAADHRPAQDILNALSDPETESEVLVDVEEWQILGGAR